MDGLDIINMNQTKLKLNICNAGAGILRVYKEDKGIQVRYKVSISALALSIRQYGNMGSYRYLLVDFDGKILGTYLCTVCTVCKYLCIRTELE